MKNLTRPTWMEIDLDSLVHNYHEIMSKLKPETDMMAIVKADAYEHGAEIVVRTLKEEGVKNFGVAHLSEALHIRKYHRDVEILVMGYTPDFLAEKAIENNITMTIYLKDQSEFLNELGKKLNKKVKIHIKIETGMNRVGFFPTSENVGIISDIYNMSNIEVEGIFSHFAVADENRLYTNDQARKFKFVLDELEKLDINIKKRHLMNSAAIMNFFDYGYDMVRAGAILYGVYPFPDADRKYLKLKSILSLKSTVTNIKEIHKGESLSYGLIYTADKTTKIATIPLGYADGYNRRLSNIGRCIINGSYAPIVGRICMDQLMVDISGIDVEMGDEVVFIGKAEDKEITLEEVAGHIDEIPASILCMFTKRLPRVYTKGGEIVEVKDYLLEL